MHDTGEGTESPDAMTDNIVVKSVHKIVQAMCKKRGYASCPSESDVEIVLEAQEKLDEALAQEPVEQELEGMPDD